MTHAWIDYTVSGLIVGNIYMLLAVGLALIFGVANLINFAHGSVYMVGAYIGWWSVTHFDAPLWVTMVAVALGCAALGMVIERVALRPLQGRARIAPLLATIGISLVMDQSMQLAATADPRSLPNQIPTWRIQIGSGTIGALDLLIAGVGIGATALLFGFLRFTRLGWAVRATALDPDAAKQVGVDTGRVNMTVFAIASALGGLSGLLVGMYYNSIDPNMGQAATLKGIVAQLIGGVGNVPGAVAGSLLLGLTESYGVALFGTTYRDLFAFVLLLVFLVIRPNGLFSRARVVPIEVLTGTFIAPARPLRIPRFALWALGGAALVLPLVQHSPYLLQTLSSAWLYALLAISLTLLAGTLGQISLGQAGFLAIGGYASALLALDAHVPVALAIPAAGLITACLGTALAAPAFRLRGHYISIATLGIGQIVGLVILNWESLTHGPLGLTNIPPLGAFGYEFTSSEAAYWVPLVLLLLLAPLQARLLRSHLGRTFRAIRDDEIAARAYGIGLNRYKALGFAFAGFTAGIAGALMAHLYSFINYETFDTSISILALTMVMLGGMGNVLGAIVGAMALICLPELFRAASDYRLLLYGVALVLLIRFRPQGLLGTA
jgi:branched-chain amino acid transport system permease protein